VTENRGADVVIEASGNSAALNEAIRIVAPERTVVALSWYQGTTAINLADEFHHNRVKIKCSQTNFTAPEFAQIWPFGRKENFCVNLLPQLELKNLITNVYDFSEIATAYSTIDLHPQDVIQCVLRY
jgi:threonine dehydrogenase-like Zn-dependent dehydrogenase